MTALINTRSLRAKQARFARHIGKGGATASYYSSIAGVIGAAVLFILTDLAVLAGGITSVALLLWMLAVWHKRYLADLPVHGDSYTDRLSTDALGLLPTNGELTPKNVWSGAQKHWQARFFTNRLLLHPDTITELMSDTPVDLEPVLQKAATLTRDTSGKIDVRHLVSALLLTSQPVIDFSRRIKLTEEDIVSASHWIERAVSLMNEERPYYGGIGRDWASGFTPKLNVFGVNISQAIQQGRAHFGTLTKSSGVHALRGALSQGASMVALIGDTGAGKTSHVYALAQSLLAEAQDPKLRHKQIVGLDATSIISRAQRPGDIEHIVTLLLHEASHAGNIILFLDNAELFFEDGHGSFDATKLLQPIAQSNVVQMILAITPRNQQTLKVHNPSFASLLTPVVLQQPDSATVIEVLQDTALNIEHKHQALITYQALKAAATLSDRYVQDLAQPGRAIRLLEQALPYAEQGVITEQTIEKSIEETQGVKLSSASEVESEKLLNLEDELHKRMINQSRAVEVVSSALRRARAGVTNPNRPLGSFLFLGPTGVGKTELAKALSATNFGSQEAMIRLDMSEFQNESDVQRLLSDGSDVATSLLMRIRQQPYSVVLLDEIEKAHPNILNLLLQLLDEGQLTDAAGKPASFKDAIIIATSNAGAQTIRKQIEAGKRLEDFEEDFTNQLISSGQFKPELLNRFDEIVLFRPLTQEELTQVVSLMMQEVNRTLAPQNISVSLTPSAIEKIVKLGYDPRLGARPMRRVVQRTVEDTVAKKILAKEINPGDTITLDEPDIS
jgi:ATP-dependent Clp protease ATP-binding subunit ClpC